MPTPTPLDVFQAFMTFSEDTKKALDRFATALQDLAGHQPPEDDDDGPWTGNETNLATLQSLLVTNCHQCGHHRYLHGETCLNCDCETPGWPT